MSTPILNLIIHGDAVGATGSTLDLSLTTLTLAANAIGWSAVDKTGSSFNDLADTPANFTGAAGKLVKVNAGGTALEFVTPSAGGVTNFVDLGDVPSTYSGAAGFFVVVNGTEDGITFATGAPWDAISKTGSSLGDLTTRSASDLTSGTLAIARGGTGTGTAPANGKLLIGKTDASYTVANLTAGTGISVTNGDGTITIASTVPTSVGKQSMWIPASAMTPRTTNGPSSGSVETTTNKVMIVTLDFDTTTQEFAQFAIRMPKSWDAGTVTFIPVWSHPATSTNFGVVWAMRGVAISDGDANDAAFGTEQTSTDTGGTTDTSYQGPESSAITIAGSPAKGDMVVFSIKRNPSDGSDTLAVDARLRGVLVMYSTDAATDA